MAFTAPEADRVTGFTVPESDQVATTGGFVTPDSDQGPTLGEIGTGLAADIAIAESARLGGAAAGTAIAPGIGTAVGYVLGGLAGGAAGSLAAQRIEGRDDISWGRVVADSLINLIPGSKAAKGAKFTTRAAEAATRGAVTGGAIGAGGATVETAIEERRLPTIEELQGAGISGAVLGGALGVSGESLVGAYRKFAGLPERKLTEAYNLGDPDAKLIVDGIERNAKEYGEEVQKQYTDLWDEVRERYSDENVRARVLQKQAGGGQYQSKRGEFEVPDDEADYYLQRRLAEGKIEAQNQEVADAIRLDQQFISKKSQDLGTDAQQLSDEIDIYLEAKHAPAYNKRLGDGAAGITTKEANERVKSFESRGLDQELASSIKVRTDLSRKILDTLVDGGLVSKSLAKDLRKQNPDYVPLNRVVSDDSIDDALKKSIQSGGVRSESKVSGLRRAKGSELERLPITENIYTNLVEATRRAEINKANIAFKRMVDANPQQEVVRIRKARGKEQVKDDALTIFQDGERYVAEFKDKKLARAMKGMNRQELSGILKLARSYNRFIGGLYTRFNPEFLIPNLVRDRSEAFVNAASKVGFKRAASLVNPKEVATDMNTIRGALMKTTPTTPEGIEMRKLYEEFRASGGSSGGLGLTTVKDVENEITELAKKIDAPVKQKVRALNELVGGINEVVEDATRFGTYRRALASGMTKDQAALAARDSSFDPRLAGSEGDVLRALYLFSNPAIQGAKNFLRSMRKPKVAASVMGGLTALTASLDQWNSSVDEDWREKLQSGDGSNWKTNKNLIIVNGKNEDRSLRYVTIPIGYSMVPFKVAADYGQRLARGVMGDEELQDPRLMGAELAQEIIDSYNPMGGSPIPTILRPFHELATNKDGLGRDIRPSWLEESSASETVKVYPWTAKTRGGEMAMALADTLQDMGYETSPENLLYLYQTWFGGPGNTVKRLFEVSSKLHSGEDIDKRDIPIARRFFGKTYAEAFERRTGRIQTIEAIDKQEETESVKSSLVANQIFDKYLDAGTPEEKAAVLRTELRGNEEVNESVIRRLENKIKDFERGVTTEDKQVRAMNTTSRANYYSEIIQNMDRQDAVDYLLEHQQKGILTPAVEEKLIAIV